VLITVNPIPVITNTGPQLQITVCSGTALNFTPTSTVGGTTYTWTSTVVGPVTGVNASGSGAVTDTPVNTGNTAGTVTYHITPTAGTCSGTARDYVVTVSPVPDASASDQPICSGSTTNVAITNPNAVAGTTFSWVVQGSSNVTGAGAGSGATISQVLTSTDGTTAGTVTYRITPTANGCSGPFVDVTVTVNPVPVITDTAPQLQATVCSGTALNFTPASTVGGTTYTWTSTVVGPVAGVSAGGSGAVTDTPVNTGSTAGTVTYHIKPTVGTCNGAVKDYTVTVEPVPSANGTNSTICSGSNAVIAIDPSPQNVAGTTFAWTATSSANTLGATSGNGSTINQVLTLTNYSVGTTTYSITPTANNCNGPVKNIVVTVNPIATVNAGVDYAVCEPSTIALSGTIGGAASTGTWQIVSGNGSISSSTVSGTIVTATYTVVGSDIATTAVFRLITNDPDGLGIGCIPVSDDLNVSINRAATVSLPSDYTVCEPTTIPLTGTIGGSASSGLWSIVSGNGILSATNVSGNTVTASYQVDPSDISTVVKFRLTTNDSDGSGPCTSVSADINVTINRAAKVFAPASISVCQDTTSVVLGGSIGGSTSTTVWSNGIGASGTYSNVNDPNASYIPAPSELNRTVSLTIPLILTALDPDGAGPCVAVSTQTNLTINPLPSPINFTGLPQNGTPPFTFNNIAPYPLQGTKIGGLFTVKPDSSHVGNTTASPGGDVSSFDPSIATIGLNTITYSYTDLNGCSNSNSQNILVYPVTSAEYYLDNTKSRINTFGDFEVCANQGKVLITGSPLPSQGKSGSTFTKFKGIVARPGGPIAPVQVDPGDGDKWYLLTDGLASDYYAIQYDYEDPLGGQTSRIHTVHIFAAPQPKIILPDTTCVVGFVQLKGDTTPVATPFPTYVNRWSWQLADAGNSLMQNPSIKFPTPGPKTITLTVSTKDQFCTTDTTVLLNVGDFPKPDFGWQAICTFDKTTFVDKTNFKTGKDSVSRYDWHFGDGIVISGAKDSTIVGNLTTDSTYSTPKHIYPGPNNYNVTMRVYTRAGCSDSVTKTIFILPTQNTISVSATSAYTQNFNSSDGGWKFESLNTGRPLASSWEWEQNAPTGKYINTGTGVWWTGLKNTTYDSAESSAINGPCFNLSQLNRPMISLDYWVNTPKSNNDGAALQYSTDGGGSWVNIGRPLQGINWYSPALIVSNPGNQPVGFGPYGWSGPTQAKWLRGSFSLDSIPKSSRKQVRIRIAFAGDASKNIDDTYNGFAFDNVFVGNKTRNVLIEHFTNATLPISRSADLYFDSLYRIQTKFRNDSSDFYDLQYHVRFPQPDVFADESNNDPSARALYFGVQTVPYSVMDGLPNFSNSDYSKINQVEIDRRALSAPQLLITNKAGKMGAIDTLNSKGNYSSRSISISFKVAADSLINYPLLGQAVLVQDLIMDSGSPYPYRNVVRKLLFGSGGIVKNDLLQPGDTTSFTKESIPIEISVKANDTSKFYVIAFVQNFTTKEILQSAIMRVNPKKGKIITAIDPSVASLDDLQLYPNPASGKFNLSLPGEFPAGSIWKISDQRGINVLGGNFIDAVRGVKTIDVSGLINGVYIVAVAAPGTVPVYRKLIVLN
ncbi:MAG: hypothetical protein JST48_12710, partial [Bacteroidetes bacterium]|nr:hypothetical protein [Bacteroidota bacterium]